MIFWPHIDTLYRFLSICIIYAYLSYMCTFLWGTGHLVEKEKTSHYVLGGHTDYCEVEVNSREGRRRVLQIRYWAVSGTNRPAGKTSTKHLLHFSVLNGIYSSSTPPRLNLIYKAVDDRFIWSLFGIKSLDCKRTKDALDQVFWHHLVWAPAEAPLVKIPATGRRCIGA